jgi:3-methylcrotonyl-CoA carboxylase alpha subunit
LMGNKRNAREFAASAGVPLLKAEYGTPNDLLKLSSSFRFPVLIKAQAGGGGKGMHIVNKADELEEALEITSAEALRLFADGDVYIEEYISRARHIEVQVLGDMHGNVVHLYERECTLQRRHQKIIEEAPSPTLNDNEREKICQTALKLAKRANYYNAGTIEFVVDEANNFYFLEMNTRIQVEHPVTEFVIEKDIVKEQLSVAQGDVLTFGQSDVVIRKKAIECRIYAEDPTNGFTPSPGLLTLHLPPKSKSVRVDGSFEITVDMSPAYDPLIGKVITGGDSRLDAMNSMIRALNDYHIHGAKTNKGFLTSLLKSSNFFENKLYTRFCDEHYAMFVPKTYPHELEMLAAPALISAFGQSSHGGNGLNRNANWRHLNYYRFTLGDKTGEVTLRKTSPKDCIVVADGHKMMCKVHLISEFELKFDAGKGVTHVWWSKNNNTWYIELNNHVAQVEAFALTVAANKNPNDFVPEKMVRTPLPGRVTRVQAIVGTPVRKGDTMIIVESMKTENRITAQFDSVIKTVFVHEGQQLKSSDKLVELE